MKKICILIIIIQAITIGYLLWEKNNQRLKLINTIIHWREEYAWWREYAIGLEYQVELYNLNK